MKTPIIYDPDTFQPRDDDVARPVTGDRRILELFPEWLLAAQELERYPVDADDDPAFCAAGDRFYNLGETLLDAPAEDMVGVAVKVFVEYYLGFVPGDGTQLARDVARLAPDLARVLLRDSPAP